MLVLMVFNFQRRPDIRKCCNYNAETVIAQTPVARKIAAQRFPAEFRGGPRNLSDLSNSSQIQPCRRRRNNDLFSSRKNLVRISSFPSEPIQIGSEVRIVVRLRPQRDGVLALPRSPRSTGCGKTASARR